MRARIHDFPGEVLGLSLRLPASSGDGRELDHIAWQALAAGAVLFEPLALEAVALCVDPAAGFMDTGLRPETTSYFLRREDVPGAVAAEVSPAYIDARVVVVPDIDEPAVLTALAALRREPCGAGLTASWEELAVDAVAIRLPEPREGGPGILELEHDLGTAEVPIEWRRGQAWVLGPSEHVSTAPLSVSITGGFGADLALGLYLRWSVWTVPGSAGARLVQEYLAALAALGWRLERA